MESRYVGRVSERSHGAFCRAGWIYLVCRPKRRLQQYCEVQKDEAAREEHSEGRVKEDAMNYAGHSDSYLHLYRAPQQQWILILSRSMDSADQQAIIDSWLFETKREARKYATLLYKQRGAYPHNF